MDTQEVMWPSVGRNGTLKVLIAGDEYEKERVFFIQKRAFAYYCILKIEDTR